jgi:transposase
MLFRTILLLVTLTLVCSAATIFNLKIFPQNEKKIIGTLLHKEIPGGGFIRSLKFYDENHNLVAETLEEFDKFSNPTNIKKINNLCPSQNQTIYINNGNAKIHIGNNNLNISVPNDVTFGTGFFDRSRDSIEPTLKGEEVKIVVLVPEKEDWFTLIPTKIENIPYNGSKAIKLTIAPKSFIIRMFAKEIVFILDTSKEHKPLEFISILPFYNSSCEPMVGKIYFNEEKASNN